MTRVYLGDLEQSGDVAEMLSGHGYEVVDEAPPDDPAGNELAVVSALTGVTSTFRHQLNNPLTAVLGFAELLLRNSDLTPEIERKVSQIQQNARRVRDLLQRHLRRDE